MVRGKPIIFAETQVVFRAKALVFLRLFWFGYILVSGYL